MSIVVADLKFFAAERMTDESDGGGRMSAVQIVSGTENGVFDDLSDVDRAVGDASLRKVYAAVASDTADKYLDAGVVIFKPPADPAVSVLAFSTGSSYDERSALKAKVESSITRGSRHNGYLWSNHSAGQRAVTIWQRSTSELPTIGRRLDIAAFASGVETHNQILWITRVTDTLITIYESYNNETLEFTVRRVICELAEPLTDNYTGCEPGRSDGIYSTTAYTYLYDTRYNSGALPLHGIQPLTVEAGVGDYSVQIADLYAPLIPTAFAETALADTTPGGDSQALAASADTTINFTTTLNVIGPGKSLFIGSGALPGYLSVMVSGSTLSDSNGKMLLAGAEVGTVNYSTGVILWNSACPSYGTATKTVVFIPAVQKRRIDDTAAQGVTVENRGFIWILTLAPIPAPGSLRVSYRVNNEWYTITDGGSGVLTGADSSYGTGTLDSTTGTVVLQTTALPDVGSDILYAWGTAIASFARGGEPVAAPVVRGQTVNPHVLPGSVSLSWVNGATTNTLTDTAGDGLLTGTGGAGGISYTTGAWWVQPTLVPAMGTDFVIDYEWGDPAELLTDTFDAPVTDTSGALDLALTELPKPGTLRVMVSLVADSYVQATGQDTETIPPPVAPPTPATPIIPPDDPTYPTDDPTYPTPSPVLPEPTPEPTPVTPTPATALYSVKGSTVLSGIPHTFYAYATGETAANALTAALNSATVAPALVGGNATINGATVAFTPVPNAPASASTAPISSTVAVSQFVTHGAW